MEGHIFVTFFALEVCIRFQNLCFAANRGAGIIKIMIFSESLKKNHQFQLVYQENRSYANKYLVMYLRENGTERNRVGISVSKKVGNSVVRHRITRLVRESYRLQEAVFNSGLDIVIVARKRAAFAGYGEIENALLSLGRLHHIISL